MLDFICQSSSVSQEPTVSSPTREGILVNKLLTSNDLGIFRDNSSSILKYNIQLTQGPQLEFSQIKNLQPLPPSPSGFDQEADQQIESVFASPTGLHTIIDYTYQGKTYPLLLIRNPKRLPRDSYRFLKPVTWSFVLASPHVLPQSLENHLKDLAPLKGLDPQDYHIALGKDRQYNIRALFDLVPTRVNQEGNLNLEFDQEIQKIFASKKPTNRLFRYEINGEPYIVRIVHNPTKTILNWSTERGTFQIAWDRGWSMIIDRPAPQDLLDRLAQLSSRQNCKIYNGTMSYLYQGQKTSQNAYNLCELLSFLSL